MQIQISIPTEKETAIINAFAKQFSYQAKLWVEGVEIDNPQTKKNFMKEKINSFIKDVYRQSKISEIDEAKAQAMLTADVETNSITII